MVALVQATCPGCKKVLRIPADWLRQPIRCKYCGLIMAAKGPPSPPRATPLPPTRPSLVQKSTPPSPPVPPLVRPASAPRGPFDDFGSGAEPADAFRRPGTWWKGPLVFLLLAGVTGAFGYLAKDHIVAKFRKIESEQAVARADTREPEQEPPKETAGDSPGEKEPTKTDPPKTDPPRTDPPKTDPPKKDPPKTDPPKTDPPKTDPPKSDPPKTDPPKVDPPKDPKPPPVAGLEFPRRALIISVHNYIYANPTGYGYADRPGRKGENIGALADALNNGLRIPLSQIYLLSDYSPKDPHPPLKLTIEQTLTSFLDSSRPQDRLLVFFAGHAVEIEGKAYLVPLEGELQNPGTLIDLDWVLKRMEACKARQKILVLDGNRFNPTQGLERPAAGPMTEKFDALLKQPPAGVQVWTACVKDQQSYETGQSPMGSFLSSLRYVLKPHIGEQQRPTEPIPLDQLNQMVVAEMKKELTPLKLEQTPRLTGTELPDGVAFNPKEPEPPSPRAVLPPVEGGGRANQQLIKLVFDEVSTPPVKASANDTSARYDLLPPFSQTILENYKADEKKDSALRLAVHKARAALWAVSPQKGAEPPELKAEVAMIRADLKVDLSKMIARLDAPTNEMAFKGELFDRERDIAKIMGLLDDALVELKEAGKLRDEETKRWQANYDFTLARLEAQIAYLYEYQSMLGQMRKELPPRDPAVHKGWVLAAGETLTGDSAGKKLAASSRNRLDKIAADNAGTPWEVLAKREKLTALGLEWKASR